MAMMAMVEECMKVNDLTDAYIRLVVTRGAGKIVFDAHFNLIFHAGHPFHGDFFAVPYCAAFG